MNDSSATILKVSQHAASEEVLACRVQEGCERSFEELVRRLYPRLLFVLQRRLQNHADAEDVAQKTLLRAYENIASYNANRKFAPWLFTIGLRLAVDHHRQQKSANQATGYLVTAVADPQPTPEQQAIRLEQSDDLWSLAEKTLKPDQWTALWLLYGEGQTVKEIAQSLGRTQVSVRVLLFRSRKVLAPLLAKFSLTAEVDLEDGVAIAAMPQIMRAES